MVDKIATDARLYTDVQGLEQLRYQAKSDANTAKKEVTKQFEAILLQMVMRSMRDATKAMSSDLLSNDQMDMYQDIFDKQLSIMMSTNGVGFAEMVEKNIDGQKFAMHDAPKSMNKNTTAPVNHEQYAYSASPIKNEIIHKNTIQPVEESQMHFETQEDFVKNLLPAAKVAANLIGGDPEIILAQAALETNWGKNIIPQGKDKSSYNLFNIKAGGNWDKQVANKDTLEQKNGIVVKEKASFRSYHSAMDSFVDYANFIKQNDRYNEAVNNAQDPHKYVRSLQKAGYATDNEYADKIMQIYSSPNFKNLVAKVGNKST